jgi:hypothetical protein
MFVAADITSLICTEVQVQAYARSMAYRYGAIAVLCCAGAACGSSQAASDAGAGSCGVGVPAGQACNTIASVGATVGSTCQAGTIPTGTGGTIVDGTYTLTAQTYYNGSTSCTSEGVNATLEIAGGCIQEVSTAPLPVTVSTSYTVSGATITRTVNCIDLVGVDAGNFTLDTPMHTFTATPTTFTIFIKNSGTSSPNPDRVEVYTKS